MCWRPIALLLLLTALPLRSSVAAEPLRFGMLGNSLVWTWMSPQMFDAQRALGVQDARIEVIWSDLQRRPGEIDFRVADNRFLAVRGTATQRTMRAMPTIHVGRGWMTCDKPCEQLFADGICERQPLRCQSGCECCQRCGNDSALSRPPLDLGDEPDPEFAYSRTYYAFMRAFVERYRDQLAHVVIENEISNPQYWDEQADPDGILYLRLLATAYKAVKDVEPRIQVSDSGLGSTYLGICIARHRLEIEQQPAAEVFAFLHDYLDASRRSVAPPEDLPRLDTVDDLGSFLAATGDCRLLDHLLAEGAVDLWNFHSYEGDRTLAAIPAHFAYGDAMHGRPQRPVLSNELSCRAQNGGSPRDEARCLFKTLTTAQAVGLRFAVWFGVAGRTGVSTWDSAGNDRPAAGTYRMLATRLGDKARVRTPPQRGPDLFRAEFAPVNDSATGAVALWTWNGAVHSIQLPAPGTRAVARIFDYLGGIRAVTEPGQLVQLEVGNDPQLVVWEGVEEGPPPCPGDCNGDHEVTIDELVTGVTLALSSGPLDVCPGFDIDGSGNVTIDELVRSVAAALQGCTMAG